MARSRSVKPDFFDDPVLARCSHGARLVFISCWQLADRVGVLELDPTKLKKYAFGYDDILVADVEKMVNELFAVGVMRWTIDAGKPYAFVVNLTKHQHFHKEEKPKFAPLLTRAAWVSTPYQHGVSTVPAPVEQGASTPVICNPESVISNPAHGAGDWQDEDKREPRATRQLERFADAMWQEREKRNGLPGVPLNEIDRRNLSQIIRAQEAAKVSLAAVLDEWFRPEWKNAFGWSIAQLAKRVRDVINTLSDPSLRPKLRNGDDNAEPAKPKGTDWDAKRKRDAEELAEIAAENAAEDARRASMGGAA